LRAKRLKTGTPINTLVVDLVRRSRLADKRREGRVAERAAVEADAEPRV
jgi:hypothetical protein